MLALLCVILLGSVVRFHDLGEESFWADEAYTALFVQEKPLKGILTGKAQDRVNPPLLYIVSKPFLHTFASAEFGLRFLPALFGILLIPTVYWVGLQLTAKTSAALWVASMTALSPALIRHSQEARSYTLYTLLALLFIGCTIKLLARPQQRAWIVAASLVAVFGVYTHYGFWTLLAAQGLLASGVGIARKQWRVFGQLVIPVIVASVAFLPWFFVSTYPRLIQSSSSPFWQPPLSLADMASVFGNAFLNPNISHGAFLTALFLIGVGTLALARRTPRLPQLTFLMLTLTLPFIVFCLQGTWLPRYTLFTIPLLYILLAWITLRRGMLWLPILLLSTTLIAWLPWAQDYYGKNQNEQWRPVIASIEAIDNGKGKIYLNRQFHRFPLKWYYDGSSKVYLPTGSHIRTPAQYRKNMRLFPWIIIIEARQNKRSAVLLQSARRVFPIAASANFGEITVHTFSR